MLTALLLLAAPDISFADARRISLEQAPQVELARRRTDVSRAEVGIASALANPTFTVTSGLRSARLGTGVSVPLPVFGQRGKAIDAAQSDARVAQLEVEVFRRDARWAATVAWVDLWEAQERKRLLDTSATDAKRVLEIANEKFSAGTGAQVDVLRTRADAFRAVAEAETAGHSTLAAAARLAPFLGADPQQPLTASGAPEYGERLPPLEGLDLLGHPALKRDLGQVAAADAHLEAEQRLRWPTVNAQVAVNQFDPGIPNGPDVIFGLSFDLPVLSLRGGAIDRARAQRLLAETNASVETRQLRAETLDAWQRVEGSAARRLALKAHVLPDLEQARALTEEGYRMGRLELLRVLEAQKALLESRLGEVDAHATWARAVADLERAANLTLAGATLAP